LLALLAHLEAGIDFVEEDISFIEQGELTRTIERVTALLRKLRATTREGRLLREGARVVILGRPNVGKSSVMNRLLKEERAIVTAIAGTTRDVIEESIDLGGLTAHLVDTAGIRETDDEVEREGVKRSRAAQEEADLQLIVIDGSLPLTGDDLALIDRAIARKHVVAINKCDLPLHVTASSLGAGVVSTAISAKSGVGIDAIRETIRVQLVGSAAETSDGVMITNVRHQTALERAESSLQQARGSIMEGMAAELVAIDVRSAADALGEITGAITTDEILEKIFSEFCIGK
jgi:tRNA modification GTPase